MGERFRLIQGGDDGAETSDTTSLNAPQLSYQEARGRHPAGDTIVANNSPGTRKLFVAGHVAQVLNRQFSDDEPQVDPLYDGATYLDDILDDIQRGLISTGQVRTPSSAPLTLDRGHVIPFPHPDSPIPPMSDPPSGSAA